MDIGTLTGELTIDDLATMVLERFEKKLDEVAGSVDSSMEHVSTSMRAAATVGSFLGNTFSNLALQAVEWGKNVIENSLMAGARLEQLGAVTRFLGERAGYTSSYIDDLATKIEKSGITGVQSRDAIVQLISAHIDLSKATQLSAVAQNMATISGESSSVTFGKIIRGITTLQPELLKTAGFTVNLDSVTRQYTETTGKSAKSLDGAAKQQLLLNAVLKEGAEKAGLYGLSMEFAGKQAGSAERAWEQVSEQIGTVLLPITTVAIKSWYSLGSAVRDFVHESGTSLRPVMESIASGLQTVISTTAEFATTSVKVAVEVYNAYQKIPEVFRFIGRDALLAAAGIWAVVYAFNALANSAIIKFLWGIGPALLAMVGGFGQAVVATAEFIDGLAIMGGTIGTVALVFAEILIPLATLASLGTAVYNAWKLMKEGSEQAAQATAENKIQQMAIAEAVKTVGRDMNATAADVERFGKGALPGLADAYDVLRKKALAAQNEVSDLTVAIKSQSVAALDAVMMSRANNATLDPAALKRIGDAAITLRENGALLTAGLTNAANATEILGRKVSGVIDPVDMVAERLKMLRTDALVPLTEANKQYVQAAVASKTETEDQIVKLIEKTGASESAIKAYIETVKKNISVTDAHNKKVQELSQGFRGAGKEILAFEESFSKLSVTELGNADVQRRLVPEINKLTMAQLALHPAMLDVYNAALASQEAAIKEEATKLSLAGVTLGYIETQKKLGRSEENIAVIQGVSVAGLKQYAISLDEVANRTSELADIEHLAWERWKNDEEKKATIADAAYLEIDKAQQSYNDSVNEATMSTTEFQIYNIQKWQKAALDGFKATTDDGGKQQREFESIIELSAKRQIDTINLTYNTLESRLRKQSVFTKSELATQASAFKTTYDQMVASGNYTSEQLVAAWHRYADAAKTAGVGVSLSWRAVVEDLKGVLMTIPDILTQAFTGGGNLIGAIKALGVQLVNTFVKDVFAPLQTVISNFIDGMVKKLSGVGASKLGSSVAGAMVPGMIASTATSAASKTVGTVTGNLVTGGIAASGGMIGAAGSTAAVPGAAAPMSGLVPFLANPITIGVAAALVAGFVLYKKLHQPEWAKLGSDIGRDMGVSIPKEMLKAWEPEAKQFGRQATTLLHLDEILKQAGGLTTANFTMMAGRLRDTFVLLGQNILTTAQATEILDKNFTDFVTAGTSNVGVLNKSVVELIRLQDEFGTKSKAIADYQAGQAAKAGAGLTTALSVPLKALQSYDDLNQKQMDIRAKMAQAKSSKELEKLQAELKAVQAEIIKQGPLWDITKIHSQAAASAIASSLVGVIAQNMAAGMSFVEAAKAMGPAVASLQTQLELTGFTGGSAFGFIKDVVALTTNEIAGPALESIHGYAEALVGMSNIGLMNQEVFSGITSQIQGTEAALEAQGFSGKTIHAAMQTDLQKIWELQQQYGYSVDASTQSLIDQSVAEGLVGEKHKSTTQQMLDASNRMVDVLEAMATFMGVTLPKSAETGAKGVQNALNGITAPDLTADVNYHVNYPEPPRGLNESSPMSMGGIVKPVYASLGTTITPWMPRGTDVVPAMLTPGEEVHSVAQVRAEKNQQSLPQETNHYSVQFNINALDAQSVKDAVVKPGGISDLFIQDVENKKRGRDKRLGNALPRVA